MNNTHNILDLSELEHELSDQREVTDKQVYFFEPGTPVQDIRDWIQDTRSGKPTDYNTFKVKGLKI